VSPTNDTIFPAMTSALVLGGQQANSMVLDHLGARLGGYTDEPVVTGHVVPTPGTPVQLAQVGSSNLAAISEAAAALPQAVADLGGWFRGVGSFASIDGNGTAPGFSAHAGGFLAGIDRPVLTNVVAGIAAGYTHTDVQEQSTSSGAVDTGRVLLYGGGRAGSALWSATAGYAHDDISTARGITGIGTAGESHGADEFTAGGQWSLPFRVGEATLTPKTGLQFLHLAEDGFSETGARGFDLSSGARTTNSLQPYVGIAASQTFVTDGGARITPELRLGYSREIADDNRELDVDANGTTFLVQGVQPSRNLLTAGVGLTMRARDNLYLFANYDTVLHIGNTTVQTVSGGVRFQF
jgi:outer membrane autotransporter protein